MTSRRVVRPSVRAIVLHEDRLLEQKPTDDPDACYAFIGGGYEVGDTLVGRLKREFEEETNTRVVSCRYLFVVEKIGRVDGGPRQSLDHFFRVTLDRVDVHSREAHLQQHWLPVSRLKAYDLRPWIVRDVIAEGRLSRVRHLVVPLDDD